MFNVHLTLNKENVANMRFEIVIDINDKPLLTIS